MKRRFFAALALLSGCFSGAALAADSPTIDPYVKFITTSEPAAEPAGDFYRAIIRTPTYDACLTVERVNLHQPVPQVASTRLCSFVLEGKTYTLGVQNSDYLDMGWQDNSLVFTLHYAGGGWQAEEPWLLECHTDMESGAPPAINCIRDEAGE